MSFAFLLLADSGGEIANYTVYGDSYTVSLKDDGTCIIQDTAETILTTNESATIVDLGSSELRVLKCNTESLILLD